MSNELHVIDLLPHARPYVDFMQTMYISHGHWKWQFLNSAWTEGRRHTLVIYWSKITVGQRKKATAVTFFPARRGRIKEAQIRAKYAKFSWMKSRDFWCTWSETYFRQDLFPAYLFFRRQFHAIVIFRFKSISDLDSGSLPRFFGEFIYAKLKIVVS